MKAITGKLFAKASRAIRAAQALLDYGDTEFAVGRAYYAMFYVAEALLEEIDLRFRKHGAVHSAFGQHFVKTGKLDEKYHQWLLRSFEKRLTGDYWVEEAITPEEVQEMIGQATEFLAAAREYLEKHTG